MIAQTWQDRIRDDLARLYDYTERQLPAQPAEPIPAHERMEISDAIIWLDLHQFDNALHFVNATTVEPDGRVWLDSLLTDKGLLRNVGRRRVAEVIAAEIRSFNDGLVVARWLAVKE